MTLAQLSPEMLKGTPWWLLSFAALVWLYNECSTAARNLRGKQPDPLILEKHNDLKDRVEKLEAGQKEISDAINRLRQELLQSAEDRTAMLHRRLDPIAESTAFMKGAMEAFTLSFQENNRVTAEVVRNLSQNTG
jgi:hypothetical protein